MPLTTEKSKAFFRFNISSAMDILTTHGIKTKTWQDQQCLIKAKMARNNKYSSKIKLFFKTKIKRSTLVTFSIDARLTWQSFL